MSKPRSWCFLLFNHRLHIIFYLKYYFRQLCFIDVAEN